MFLNSQGEEDSTPFIRNRTGQETNTLSAHYVAPAIAAVWRIKPGSLEGPVAQWLEPAAHNGLVGGSSPSRPTTDCSSWHKAKTVIAFQTLNLWSTTATRFALA